MSAIKFINFLNVNLHVISFVMSLKKYYNLPRIIFRNILPKWYRKELF